jgi:hypothetical protein
MYYSQERDYSAEMKKINDLEQKQQLRQQALNAIRAQTTVCPVSNLNDPRTCYINSNYTCSWNEQAERCDKIA